MQDPRLVYEKQSVINASPLQLVVKLYDLAIQATYREDAKRFRDIMSTLIQGLNFDHEPAGKLFQLYKYCQDLSRKERYDEIREILEPLRESWEEVSGGNVSKVS